MAINRSTRGTLLRFLFYSRIVTTFIYAGMATFPTADLKFTTITTDNCITDPAVLYKGILQTNEVENPFISIPINDTDKNTILFQFQKEQNFQNFSRSSSEFCRSTPLMPHNCQSQLLEFYFAWKYSINLNSQVESPVPWLSQEVALVSYSDDIVKAVCRKSLVKYYGNASDCKIRVRQGIKSVKLINSFRDIDKLLLIVDNNEVIPLPSGWSNQVEGHTFVFHDKVRYLQSLADDKRVKTICEIGFNFGHSTINWINANPAASIITFDILRHSYTAVSVNGIYQLHPARNYLLIAGDSNYTIPQFHRNLQQGGSNITCNILFIDGAHDYRSALSDIINMRSLADKEYHRVVIDDGLDEEVRQAVFTAAHSIGMLSLHEEITSGESSCEIATVVDTGIDAGLHIFKQVSDEKCQLSNSRVSQQDSVFVGEYKFI